MQAHNNTIEEYLGAPKTVFVVPVYQRNYDWKDENCSQLFNDIIKVVESGKEHFLGTICFKVYSSHERSIIDGQQRLTSISLMLKAIYDFDDDEENRDEIRDQYLYNKGRGIDTDFLRFKMHLNKRDDVVYHILLENTKDTVDSKLTPAQKKSRVYQNYLLFYDMVADYVTKGGSAGDILEALRSLTIIELEIQQENPQEIFESLNSTGLDLTKVDLLRNYFLMQFDHKKQTELYEDYWSQIEDVIGTDRMEQFFVDFLVFRKRSDAIMVNGRRSHVNENSLYIAFKDYYASLPYDSNYEKTKNCFSDLKDCADIYKQFLFPDDINLGKESPIRKKLYFLLSINDSTKARSLLLYIFDLHKRGLIDEDMLDQAVDGVSSLTFRARVCKAQGLNRQFAGTVMARLDEIDDYSTFIDSFWKAMTIGRGSYAFPTDAEFLDALETKPLYVTLRSRGAKCFLYMMEMHSPFHKGLPAFDDETITVEHIMPQTLNAQWKVYLSRESMENYESILHRLGNLALTNYNGEMSNKSFDEKKAVYKNTNYHYTKEIVGYDEWQIGEIDRRSKALAQEALKIWPLPAQYQTAKAAPKSLHKLGEDTAQFAFTKPSTLTIGNNEYPVNYWADFLPLLCGQLDKEDHRAFVDIAVPDRISAFGLEDDDHNYKDNTLFWHVVDNIYVRQFMSASSILETVSKITNAFDKAAGTDYEDNILFSLK